MNACNSSYVILNKFAFRNQKAKDPPLLYANGPGFFGAAVEYSYDTIFGPLSANVHWSDLTGKVGVYISAGYNF